MVVKHDNMKKSEEDDKNYVEKLLENPLPPRQEKITNVTDDELIMFSGDRQVRYRSKDDKVRGQITITFFEDPLPPIFEFSSAINGADRKSVERYLRREYKRAKMVQVRKEENDG